MEDFEDMAPTPVGQPTAPRRRGLRWLLIGGLTFAFMLALAVGVFIGSSTGATQAAALTSGSASNTQAQGGANGSQSLVFAQGNNSNAQPFAGGPGRQGGPGQCEMLTVSSVNGSTIVAKTANGSSVTIHTTASTKYTQAGKAVAASAIKAGTRINVMGTHNSDGSITATSIDVG